MAKHHSSEPGSADWNLEQRGETPMQRADRNYSEMLAELRVLQAGVQILFGFLLILAVQPRFASVSQFERISYVVTLSLCALSTALLMAPVAYHRAMFSRGHKPDVVRVSNQLTRLGTFALFLAMAGATLLVLDFTLSRTAALIITAVIAAAFTGLWYVLPLFRLSSREDSPSRDSGE